MKKLLTIVVVALVLCLGISVAVAANYSGQLAAGELQDLLADSTQTYGINTDELSNIKLDSPTVAELRATAHEEYVNAKITGTSKQTGKNVTTEVQVQWTCHEDYLQIDYEASNFTDCEKGGKLVKKCTYPGCTYTKTEEYPAVPHSFVKVNTATCTDKGKTYDKCSVCGYFKADALGNPIYDKNANGEVIETPALGHKAKVDSQGKTVYTATVTCNPNTQRLAGGKVQVLCARCGKGYDADPKNPIVVDKELSDKDQVAIVSTYIPKWDVPNGHNFEEKHYKDFAATCTKNGGYTVWCKNCGWMYDVLDSKQPALGHVWGLDTLTSCKDIEDWFKYDDETNTYTHILDSWAPWVCTRCGEEVDPENVNISRTYDKLGNVTGAKVVATIEGKKYTAYFTHSFKTTGNTMYSAPGMHEDALSRINSDRYNKYQLRTWCEEGYVSTQKTCTVCGMELWVSSKLGHDYGAWEVVNDKETFGTTTSRFQRVCLRCGTLEVKASSGIPCGDNEHDWIPVDKTKTSCKSVNAGTKLICTKCGANKTDEFPIEDHDWKEISVVTPATCEKVGSHVMKCAWCGAIEEQEIPVVAHKLDKVEKVAATCAKTGTEEYYKCSVCGKLFSDAEGKTEIEKAVEIAIDEDAHAWDEGKITKEATKEAKGEKTYTCTVCGKTKTEEVDYKVTAKAAYTLKDVKYSNLIVSGKLEHVEDTLEAAEKGIRVTFYNANTYVTTTATLYADGTFECQGGGAVDSITVAAYATEKVVDPAGLSEDNWFGSTSIEVK